MRTLRVTKTPPGLRLRALFEGPLSFPTEGSTRWWMTNAMEPQAYL